MDAIQLLLLSIIIFFSGGLASLLLSSSGRAARQAAGWLGLAASLFAIAAAATALFAALPPTLRLFQAEPFGYLVIQIDSLSAFMLGLIGLIGAAASFYSLSAAPESGSVGFFTNLFMASMLLVVCVGNTFYFLIFWELMTLASYFLVTWQTEDESSIRTGYIYMLIAHAGAALIMVAFLVLFYKAGSFNFDALRASTFTSGVKSLVFLLAFLGFGAKAGMVPLHFWTPATYAAAPDHVSALMAGVMKKVAVYGLLRIGIYLLGVPLLWWGLIVIAFGALSAVIGSFYALSERDLKRLLAYSSVENLGIILMGVGIGMVGLSVNLPVLAGLGFLAALYHTLNHGFFKALLFMATGAASMQAGTQDLNRMGGMARRMPRTALAFLIGALAVTAIPPFNGFVSEWFTYQAFFTAGLTQQNFIMRVISPIFAILLTFAGAFAVMVYIKAYGGAFTGPARSQSAAKAQEAPGFIQASLAYLAIGCLFLGLGAPLVAPVIASVATRFAGVPPLVVSNGWQVFPTLQAQAVLSPPLVAILLLGLLVVPVVIIAVYGGRRAGRRSSVEPWACGYGYSSSMSVPASGFDQPVKVSFHILYWLRTLMEKPFQKVASFALRARGLFVRLEPVIETIVTRPTTRLVETAGQWVQGMQMGDIRIYCLYIIVTLTILLIAILGGSGL